MDCPPPRTPRSTAPEGGPGSPPDAVVEERAPAKINLDLHVLGKRPDGYHELDSIVVFADLADRLFFEPASDIGMDVAGPEAGRLDGGAENLVFRAALALCNAVGTERGARITLDKRIPIAAGLGGGSADAAATLRGLRRLWRLDLGDAALQRIAGEIGADVPVCLQGGSVRMRGIGERLSPVVLDPLDLVLVNPRIRVATREVFALLAAPPLAEGGPPPARKRWQDGKNDLEAPARRLAPVIGEVLDRLRREPGARLARMSGSGATCFALFDGPEAAAAAALRLRASRPGWLIEAVGAG